MTLIRIQSYDCKTGETKTEEIDNPDYHNEVPVIKDEKAEYASAPDKTTYIAKKLGLI